MVRQTRRRAAAGAALAVLLTLTSAACQPANTITWDTELVTVDAAGTGGGSLPDLPGFGSPELVTAVASPDGALVAFTATGRSYGPNDTNGTYDVYVRDLAAGSTSLVSARASGSDSGNGFSAGPTFSSDGTRVLFTSAATDLTAAGDAGTSLFVRDLTTGTTYLAGPGGSQGVFTPDGTKVAFATSVGLTPEDVNDTFDVYVRELSTGATDLVSVNAAGTAAGHDQSHSVAVSPDGAAVAFSSFADDLASNDANGQSDVFIRDLGAGTTTLVSTNAAGTQSANSGSQFPVYSPDGRSVLFSSNASDLGPTDTNASGDVYVRALDDGATDLVSVNASGSDSGAGPSDGSWASFSPDGTKVVFSSQAPDLVEVAVAGSENVFVRDLAADVTTLASVSSDGAGGGNGWSLPLPGLEFTSDGSKVVFASAASNLGPNDSNSLPDVYLRDLVRGTTSLVSANAGGTDAGNRASTGASLVAGGTAVLFRSEASDRVATDTDVWPDFHLSTGRQADLTVDLAASPEPVSSGGDITYSLEVANAGPDPAPDTSAALLLPEGTALLDPGRCDPSPSNPRLVICAFGELASGGFANAVVTARVDAGAGSHLVAVAAVGSAVSDPGQGNVAEVESTVS